MNRSTVFLRAYAETCSVTKACEAAKISRGMHYRRLKSDEKYRTAFEELQDQAVATLEDEAVRRAHEGWIEPVVYQGMFTYPLVRDEHGKVRRSKIPLGIRKYSDSLLMFLLRGARPEKYRERFNVSGVVDVNVKKFKGSMADLLATFRELTKEEET